ncbi:hypothetical protein HETIRDRAFT_107552 [Heterobasidion irregulare TC 32-1]|uniref:Uncharacterized protein n=1 Tax=Heterobasidion irregulare (strain TC 32-1) TaxID=747525 RepID=W4JWH5_HETIT|nr:uncharacterized protein HETIRDRAFT_107552 [Heterobasidion irregulare TC 32-1]ETW77918.1 hypothetical protein HETIRDRAFT_107552 [Heterobasidion irregulare TC 32-1]
MSSKTKVVLVTGCSEGGIGFSLCEQFAEQGCKVYATARNIEKMQGFTHAGIEKLTLDVKNDEDVKRVVEDVIDREGSIDILVNNAGVGCFGPVLEIPLDQIRDVFEANTFSILRVSRVVVPHMAARKQGLIVNIGSVVGEIPTPWAGIYASSKAATHAITQVLAMECAPLGVDVTLVAPGGVRSNISSSASPTFTLPPDTLYAKFLDNIIARMWASQSPQSMPTPVFAREVVAKVLQSKPPFYVTLGHNSTIFKVFKWLPRTWVMGYLWKLFSSPKAGAK